MKVQVLVRLKSGVLDVQGKAVENSLRGVGVKDVDHIRVGRLIEMDVDASNFEDAKKKTAKLCDDLLANTIIENYEIKQG